MIPFILLASLAIMIALPILSAKGRGWRGLWFGLVIASLVVALFFFWLGISSPPITVEQINASRADPAAVAVVGGTNMFFTVGLPLLAASSFIACLIAGCVYRRHPEVKFSSKV